MATETRKSQNAEKLTVEQEKTARTMLIDGATFEDVVLTLGGRGQSVAQHVVENYFRSNPELHALRAGRSLEIAREIRKATNEENPEDVDLADAVILTGLQRLNRATARIDVNDALRRKLERENLHLKQQVLRLQARHESQAEQFQRARTRLLSTQCLVARRKLKKLERELSRSKKGKDLSADITATIQEIYGLVQAPAIPPAGAPETATPQAR